MARHRHALTGSILAALLAGTALAAPAQGLEGDWKGALNGGAQGVIHFVLHIRTGKDGPSASMDIVDAGRFGLPFAITREGRKVSVRNAAGTIGYDGELSEDGASMQGEFSQGPALIPMAFARSSEAPSAPVGARTVAPAPKAGTFPSDAEIRKALARRIDQERRGVGIVVGVISPGGRSIVAYGVTEAGGKQPVGGKTLFEVASITKTFISLILQDMALKGEVSLDDPVGKYLNGHPSPPDRDGRPITLAELATHRSGLPQNLVVGNETPSEVYSGATEAKLDAYLATYKSPGPSAPAWSYSNLGVGMLGLALSHRAGTDLPTLVRQRVIEPLGMTSTVFGAPPPGPGVAVGHDASLNPLPPSLKLGAAEAAAGEIRSNAEDMLTYLAAELGLRPTSLEPAMRAMLATDYGPGESGMRQELGWMSLDVGGRRIFTHSGATFGQRAFIAFDPKAREGVVVLSNAESTTGTDDIGLWLMGATPLQALPPAAPALKQPGAEAVVPLSAAEARAFAGDYRLTEHITLTVVYDGQQMQLRSTTRGTPGPALPMVFHGRGSFSVPVANASVTFQMGPGPTAGGFVLRNPAGELHASRMASR